MIGATEKQKKLLGFIAWHISTYEKSPTVKETMEEFGWKSESSVARKLDSLEAKGFISRKRGENRNISVL